MALATPAQPVAPKAIDPNAIVAAQGSGIVQPGGLPAQPQTAAPPVATPAPTQPATTGFLPPATGITGTAAISSQPDPKIANLITQLTQQSATPAAPATPATIAPPDFSGTSAQSASLRALLGQLATGQGVATPDVSKDPAVSSYNTIRQRSADAQRQSEADRAAASGFSGSGDFNSRVAQINEQTGQDESGFAANLANQRRTEGIQQAETAANLQLGQIGQDTSRAQSTYDDAIKQQMLQQTNDAAARQSSQFDRSSAQALLAQLLGEQAGQQGRAQSTAVTTTELARQINPVTGLPYAVSSGLPAGTKFTATGAPILPGGASRL